MRTQHFLAPFGIMLLLTLPGLAADDPKPKADPKLTPEKALAEAMVRWNKAAEGVTATGPIGKVGFTWEADMFPHPTFKGGQRRGVWGVRRCAGQILGREGQLRVLG